MGQMPQDAVRALRANAVDGFNFNGSASEFQRFAHLASLAGLSCWHGSEVDLGILEARYVHSAAAAESCVWPSDIFGRLIRSHDLLRKPLQINPPHAILPEGPGLGVELDPSALEHFRTATKPVIFA
jgi:muconate cycloisomerase